MMGSAGDNKLRSSDITALRSALVRFGIFVYEYEEVLGNSWSLIVRKSDTMINFFWDGRDRFMLVQEAAYLPSSDQYVWRATSVPTVDADEEQEPLRYIEEVLRKKFSN